MGPELSGLEPPPEVSGAEVDVTVGSGMIPVGLATSPRVDVGWELRVVGVLLSVSLEPQPMMRATASDEKSRNFVDSH